MRPKVLYYVFVVLLLSACVSGVRPPWTKPNATPDDLHRDTVECENQAEQTSPSPTNPFAYKMKTDSVTRCMEARGWKEVK